MSTKHSPHPYRRPRPPASRNNNTTSTIIDKNNTNYDDETTLFSSIGLSLQSTATYEKRVLQSQTTPTLDGVTGFPSLVDLTPRGNVSHVLTILSRTRQRLNDLTSSSSSSSSEEEEQRLRLKEQILLKYLNDIGHMGEEEDSRTVMRREKEWSIRLISGRHRSSSSSSSTARRSTNQTSSSSCHNNHILTAEAKTLDRLKKCHDFEGESLGLHSLTSRQATKLQQQRQRVGMMTAKEESVTECDVTERMLMEERKKRREEMRETRRRKRRRLRGSEDKAKEEKKEDMTIGEEGITVVTAVKAEEGTADDNNNSADGDGSKVITTVTTTSTTTDHSHNAMSSSSTTATNNDINNKVNQHQQTIKSSSSTHQPTSLLPTPNNNRQNTNNIVCPSCQERLECQSNDDIDSFLARHLDVCQHQRQRRASTRRRKVVTYTEDNGSDDDQEMNGGAAGTVVTVTTARKPSDADDDYEVMTAQSCDADDNLIMTTDGNDDDTNPPLTTDDTVNDTITATKTTNPSKSSSSSVITPPPTPIDDFYEEDYDTRLETYLSSLPPSSSSSPPSPPPTLPSLHIPRTLHSSLFSYQRHALRWLYELHLQSAGGILGDEMGLGKTVQICSFLGILAANRRCDAALIVVPATLLRNWMRELERWSPGLRRVLCHGSAVGRGGGSVGGDGGSSTVVGAALLFRRLDKWLRRCRRDYVNDVIDPEEYGRDEFVGSGYVVVTTYESIRRRAEVWTSHDWSYVVLDEGQKIRNPDADVTLACKKFRTPHRLLLSGTPIQNDLRELWSLFDFVFPGRLGTLPAFENEFAIPIKKGGYANASAMQVTLATKMALVLKDLINPYLLRRMKRDIKEVQSMPGKTEQVLFCRLSPKQRSLYKSYLATPEVQRLLRSDKRGNTQCFRSITTLRKICNHPNLITSDDDWNGGTTTNAASTDDDDSSIISSESSSPTNSSSLVSSSGKLLVLAQILPLWHEQRHRVLIFCQWRKTLNIIERMADMNNWKMARLDGNTSVGARQTLVDKFNNDESYFGMLMTTKTGGVGLNLTGADRIILYDPDWNPQTDAQARERAWRFGQTKPVTIYRLITAGTIEEKIYHRQIFKTALTNQVLDDDDVTGSSNTANRRLFSQKDLRDLFTLGDDAHSLARGGDGVTETGLIMKGRGVIDPHADDEENNNDNDERQRRDERYHPHDDDSKPASSSTRTSTMSAVLRSRGLAGIFDHDGIDNRDATKMTMAEREMEERAIIVARRAAQALAESVDRQDDVERRGDRRPRRFGLATARRRVEIDDGRGGGAAGVISGSVGGGGVADSNNDDGTGRGLSSRAVLERIRRRNDAIRSQTTSRDDDDATRVAATTTVSSGDASRYTTLMRRLRSYVRGVADGGPTTDQLLREFDDVGDRDAAIFRRMLNSMARIENGRWRLREEG